MVLPATYPVPIFPSRAHVEAALWDENPTLPPPCILHTSACMGAQVRLSSICVRLAKLGSKPTKSCCCSAWRCDQAVLHHPHVLHPLPPVLHPLQSFAMVRLAGFEDACPLLQHLPFRLAQGLLKTILFPNLPAFPPSPGPSLSSTARGAKAVAPCLNTNTRSHGCLLLVSRCVSYTPWRLLLSFLPPWAKHCTLLHHTQWAA